MSMSCIPSAAYSTILARCTSRQVKVGVFARRSSSARSSCVSSIAQLDLRGIVAIIRQPPLVSFTNTLPDFRRRVLARDRFELAHTTRPDERSGDATMLGPPGTARSLCHESARWIGRGSRDSYGDGTGVRPAGADDCYATRSGGCSDGRTSPWRQPDGANARRYMLSLAKYSVM